MKNCEYWIWLSRTLGEGAKIDDIVNYFGSARGIYEAGQYEWKISGIMTPRQIANLSNYSPSESAKIMNTCRDNHWQIITPEDEEYPAHLRNICDYPAVLYAQGDTSVLCEKTTVAMVGTRKASGYGVRAAGVLSHELVKTGMVIVSGGALGIDSASHTGAIYGGGKTVAVLGCGLGTDYLKENAALRNEISKHGVLITEYAPFTNATRYTFPKRNRIISGMSLGTVVVEAGERSGSLITARLAMEQNRDVFALPGDVFSSAFTGANRLIRDGAKPVFTARDVAEEYYSLYPDKIKLENSDEPLASILAQSNQAQFNSVNVAKSHTAFKKHDEAKQQLETTPAPAVSRDLPDNVSDSARKVYSCIDNVVEFDDIVRNSGLGITKVLSAVTELEMLSFIEVIPGKKYKKI